MKTTNDYTFFWQDKIAQWNQQLFKDDEGIVYNCAEQYMMAQKAKLFKDEEMYQNIMNTKLPKIQQKLGREIKDFNEEIWNKEKLKIVFDANMFKFGQNEDLKEILLSTKDTVLVEASPYDLIWGVGLRDTDEKILDYKNWKGENLLGFTLTIVRKIFLENFEYKFIKEKDLLQRIKEIEEEIFTYKSISE